MVLRSERVYCEQILWFFTKKSHKNDTRRLIIFVIFVIFCNFQIRYITLLFDVEPFVHQMLSQWIQMFYNPRFWKEMKSIFSQSSTSKYFFCH